MTRKRFNLSNQTLENYESVDIETYSEAVWNQVGAEFKISVDSEGLPIIDTDDIPSGIKESTVEKALADNHPRLK